MGKRVEFFCDRCDAKMGDLHNATTIEINTIKFDLCANCCIAHKKFMQGDFKQIENTLIAAGLIDMDHCRCVNHWTCDYCRDKQDHVRDLSGEGE